jgi:neopullulanase
LNNDDKAHRLTVLCHITMPGAPSVYYGDEIGLSSGPDPYCREAFPWHKPETWNTSLRDFYKSAIKLRKSYKALRTGDFQFIYAQKRQAAYRRKLGDQEVIIAFNVSQKADVMLLPSQNLAHKHYSQVWPPGNERTVHVAGTDLRLEIPAQSAIVLVAEK